MNFRVDLHIHTNYSDGVAPPERIVCDAKKLGYEKIAITDHDGVGGIEEALDAGRKCGIEVISGIELATKTKEGIGLHILGYHIDSEHRELRKTLDILHEKRAERNKKLIAVLCHMGYDISENDLKGIQPNDFVGKPVIARVLVGKGYADSVFQVFSSEKLLASPEAKSVRKSKITSQEAIRLIKAAGGRAVLAHPIQTSHIGREGSEEFYGNIENIIRELKEQGLEGLECLHPDQNISQTLRFLEIAEKYDLAVTRGSDFHGANFAEADRPAAVYAEIGI